MRRVGVLGWPSVYILVSVLLLFGAILTPNGQARAVTDFGGALEAERAEYFEDDTFAVSVGWELWGCGGGHHQSGTVTNYVADVNWSCEDQLINHNLCFYGYVEYWYPNPPGSTNWMPYWVISGYYDNCIF